MILFISWYSLYSTFEKFDRLLKYCSYGKAEFCENQEYSIFGTFHRLKISHQEQDGLVIEVSIRTPSDEAVVKGFRSTGS